MDTTTALSQMWIPRFLDALRQTGIISDAARQVGAAPSMIYAMTQRDKGFREATNAAIQESIDALEKHARLRALSGSDAMLCKLLESLRPEKYQRKQTVTAINANISVDTGALLQKIAGNVIQIKRNDYSVLRDNTKEDAVLSCRQSDAQVSDCITENDNVFDCNTEKPTQ